MKKILLTSFLFVFALVLNVWAQERAVSGKVTSEEDGSGLPGVNVILKGTTTGTTTDADGFYRLNVPEAGGTLVFSFIGFTTTEQVIGSRAVVDVVLAGDYTQLAEVIVVGYGTQERRSLTGSVTSIKGNSISSLVTPSFDAQLAGRAAGVQVTTPSGILGARPIIRIRGVNSLTSGANPLIVIDGVPVVDSDRSSVNAANPLSNINPADIESFEVLKDGSATAIFGSRAANGVILITTKRGQSGKAQVTYDANFGSNQAVATFDVLNGDQWVTIANEKRTNANQSPLANPGVNTNWQDLIFRNGATQQHNLSIRGGSDATKYFFSAGWTEQNSAIKPNDLTRYSFRANIDHNISKRLKVGNSLSYSYTEITGLNNGANSLSGAIYNATRSLPNVPVYDADNIVFDGFNVTANGATTGFGANLAGPDNNIPNIGFVIKNNIYRSRTHRVLGNGYVDFEIMDGLVARSQIGVDLTLNDDFQSLDPRHGDGRSVNGSVFMAYNPAKRWNWANTLTYSKSIGENHNINIVAGMEYQYTNFYNFNTTGRDFSDRFYIERNLINGSYNTQLIGGGYAELGFDSYFTRVNYNYAGKYLLSLAVRNDGISSLPVQNRRGTFPGASIGWRISDEDFFNVGAISELKLRASYAEVGNTEIGAFPYVGGFSPVLAAAGAGIGFAQVANTGLQWESSKKINVGIDAVVGPLTITADYFKNDISNLVLDAPVSFSMGIPGSSISQNVGAMVNKGVELRIAAKPIDKGNFTWSTDFNFTAISNEVTKLISPLTGTYNRTEEGGPIAQLYGFKWAGVNPANGNPMYYRTNPADGVESIVQYNLTPGAIGFRAYDPANPSNVTTTAAGPTQYFLGNTLPKWQGGWSNNFTFKNFDAEIFFRYSGGNYVMNESLRGLLGQGFSNNHVSIMNRWTAEGQVTDVPKLYSGQDANMFQTAASNSRFIEKGDFVRVQNIVVGYRVPKAWLNSTFNNAISSARFYAQVQNPFIFTSYSGLDPELNVNSGQLAFGIDWNVAPIIRTYSFGLTVGF